MYTGSPAPILPPTSIKPPTQGRKNASRSLGHQLSQVRDFLSTQAWLELGAALYIPVYLALRPIIGSYVLLIPVLALLFRLSKSIAATKGYLPNPYMDDIIPGKFVAQIPDPVTGEFGPEPASEGVCVLHIGVRNNHPMGILAPGFKEIGTYFSKMSKDLEENAEEYGFLGQSNWVESGARDSQNQILSVQYFRDSVGLNKFAHGALHRDGINWWNKTVKQYPHLGIFHEVFEVPSGAWESLYVQTPPMFLGAANYPVKTPQGKMWQSGLFNASKGPLATMKGRMPALASSYV